MYRKLLATTALSLIVAGGAYAQEMAPADPAMQAPADPAMQAPADPAMEAPVETPEEPLVEAEEAGINADGWLATEIVDETIYNSTGDDAEAIGDVNDFVLDQNGEIGAVVVGVGGFLGIGQKNVAINWEDLEMSQDMDGNNRLVAAMTREQLEAAEEFNREEWLASEAQNAAEMDAAAPAGGAMAPAPAGDAMAPAPADDAMAPADDAMAPADDAMATEEPAPADDAMATEEAAPADDAMATEEEAPADDAMATEEAAPADDAMATEEAAPADDAMATEEAAPADDAMATEEAAPADDAMATEEPAPADDAMATEEAAPADDAMATEEPAPADDAMATEEAVPAAEGEAAAPTWDSMEAVATTDISADELEGAAVYGANDEDIGSIGDIILSEDGAVQAVIVDFGGFLGIATKPVAVDFENLTFVRDENGALLLRTSLTAEQLEAAPEYDENAYLESPDDNSLIIE